MNGLRLVGRMQAGENHNRADDDDYNAKRKILRLHNSYAPVVGLAFSAKPETTRNKTMEPLREIIAGCRVATLPIVMFF